MVDNESSSSSKTTTTPWKSAFEKTCMEKGTLHASIQQVRKKFQVVEDDGEMPTASSVVFWNEDTCNAKLVGQFQLQTPAASPTKNENNSSSAAPSKSLIGSAIKTVVSTTWSIAASATKSLWQSQDDYMLEKYGGAALGADDDEMDDLPPGVQVDDAEPILNMDLALQCLHFLYDTIAQYGYGNDDDNNQGILSLPGGASTAPAACKRWLHQVLGKEESPYGGQQRRIREFVQNMASKDLQFLLQALVAYGVIEILERQPAQDDLLLFVKPQDKSGSRDYKLTMFDLTRQIDNIQTRVNKLAEQQTKYKKAALTCRKNKQEKQAIQNMKMAKQLDEAINRCHGTIHNLEAQRLAMESAVDTKEILKVFQKTATVLKSMRVDVQDADEILLDVQEEFDAMEDVHKTMAHTAGDYNQLDEDDLLSELEALTLSDDTMVATTPPLAPTTPSKTTHVRTNLSKLSETEPTSKQPLTMGPEAMETMPSSDVEEPEKQNITEPEADA